MVVIRLSRRGAKNRPFYGVMVADHRMPRDGRFIEQVGYYDPRADKAPISLKMDRIRPLKPLATLLSVSALFNPLLKL
jgi:small subunit ribosomal protein S16